MSQNKQNFRNTVLHILLDKGWTVKHLGERIGHPRQVTSAALSGDLHPGVRTKIVKLLKLPNTWLKPAAAGRQTGASRQKSPGKGKKSEKPGGATSVTFCQTVPHKTVPHSFVGDCSVSPTPPYNVVFRHVVNNTPLPPAGAEGSELFQCDAASRHVDDNWVQAQLDPEQNEYLLPGSNDFWQDPIRWLQGHRAPRQEAAVCWLESTLPGRALLDSMDGDPLPQDVRTVVRGLRRGRWVAGDVLRLWLTTRRWNNRVLPGTLQSRLDGCRLKTAADVDAFDLLLRGTEAAEMRRTRPTPGAIELQADMDVAEAFQAWAAAFADLPNRRARLHARLEGLGFPASRIFDWLLHSAGAAETQFAQALIDLDETAAAVMQSAAPSAEYMRCGRFVMTALLGQCHIELEQARKGTLSMLQTYTASCRQS